MRFFHRGHILTYEKEGEIPEPIPAAVLVTIMVTTERVLSGG